MSKRKLTDTFVKNAVRGCRRPSSRVRPSRYIWDTIEPGLVLKVTPLGRKIFCLITIYPGQRTQSERTLGRYPVLSLEGAREKAQEWRRLMLKGIDPAENKKRVLRERSREKANTLSSVCEAYIAQHLADKRRGVDDAREIRRFITPVLGDRPITEIERRDVVEMIDGLKKTPGQARLVFSHLRRIFSWTINKGAYGLEASPMTHIQPNALLGAAKVRTHVLGDGELRALWKASESLGAPWGHMYRLIALTGARINEASGTKWSEFDLDKAVWTIPSERFKSGVEHRVPLSAAAVDLLKNLPRGSAGDYVFSFKHGLKPIGCMSKGKYALDAAMKAYGEGEPFTTHDVRRTVRTRLSALRIPEAVAEMVIGHAPKGLQCVYNQHSYEAEMREALEAWSRLLAQIVEPSSPGNVVELKRA